MGIGRTWCWRGNRRREEEGEGGAEEGEEDEEEEGTVGGRGGRVVGMVIGTEIGIADLGVVVVVVVVVEEVEEEGEGGEGGLITEDRGRRTGSTRRDELENETLNEITASK